MVKKIICRSSVLLFVFLLSSCKQEILHGASDFPAILINTTPQSQIELNQIVSKALNGVPVTLADDALTQTSVLIIERARQPDFNNNRVLGRDLSMPEQFRLVINNGQCFLIHQENGQRYLLSQAVCQKN